MAMARTLADKAMANKDNRTAAGATPTQKGKGGDSDSSNPEASAPASVERDMPKGKEPVSSKTKATKQVVAKDDLIQEGLEIFEDLRSEEPLEVAYFFLAQVKKLAKFDKDRLGELPLHKLALANKSVDNDQRRDVIKAAITGFEAMDARDRADALSLVVKSAASVEMRAVWHTGQESLHVTNMRAILHAAQFNRLPDEEKESLLVTAQEYAMELATPQQLSETLAQMDDAERKELTVALVKTKLIPASQAALIEDIVQPGSVLHEIGAVSASTSREDLIWALVLLPIMEWICSTHWLSNIDWADCSSSLVHWLHIDACLSLTMVLSVIAANRIFAPAYEVLTSDPEGGSERWQKSADEGIALGKRLQNALRISPFSLWIGLCGAALTVLLTVLSGVFVIWAVMLVYAAFADGCFGLSVIFEWLCVAVRVTFITAVTYFTWRICDLLQKHGFIEFETFATSSRGSLTRNPGYGSV